MNQIRQNSTSANIQDTPHTTLRSTSSTQATPAAAAAAHYLDPLAVLERQLLARPGSHGHHHHHRHQTGAQVAGHLAPPASRAMSKSRSRTPSPEPTPAARRCMAATYAWVPTTETSPGHDATFPCAFERRPSWDGQEYRHAMMVQGTSLACACHPCEHTPKHNWHARHHEISVPPQDSYAADRGFSEGSH